MQQWQKEPIVKNDSFTVWITKNGPILAIKTETDGTNCEECGVELIEQSFNIEYRFSCFTKSEKEINSTLLTQYLSEDKRDEYYDSLTLDVVEKVTSQSRAAASLFT